MSVTTLAGNIHLEHCITVSRPPEQVYRFWRNFENLPRFMKNIASVRILGPTRSHWIVKGPMGRSLEWDAEIIHDQENVLVAWRAVEGADVMNAGSVRFLPLHWGRRTEVKVALNYEPPGGKMGDLLTRLIGERPEDQIREDLHRFQQVLETGEVATIEGQPRGRCARA